MKRAQVENHVRSLLRYSVDDERIDDVTEDITNYIIGLAKRDRLQWLGYRARLALRLGVRP